MNVEFRFLQKAIQDKNYISFTYESNSYKNLKALKLDDENRLYTNNGIFQFEKIKKLQILKNKF
ncbi:MAG: hypothetical protein KA073_01665 [Aliarcobacter sp.]|nr:hypothetical protein [Aliarcobacter sp.]